MTSIDRSKTRRGHRGLTIVAALACAALVLGACGRKGAPEYDSGEPVVPTQTQASQNQLIPGLNLPQKQSTPEHPKKPKGNFILDPLL